MESPTLSEALGLPATVTHKGKVYKLGPANQSAKAHLEGLLAGNAIRVVKGLKDVLPPLEYKELFDAILSKVAAKYYATGSPGWLEQFAVQPDGTVAFILSLFRVHHPDMTADHVQEMLSEQEDEMKEALVQVVPGFFDVAFPTIPQEQRTKAVEQFLQALRSVPSSKSTSPVSPISTLTVS